MGEEAVLPGGVFRVKIGVSENTVCFRISLRAEPSKPAQA